MAEAAEYTLLQRYLGPEAARALAAAQGRPEAIGAVTQAVVLFADIRHSSLLAEQLSLELLHGFLSDFFRLFVEEIGQGGGVVDKFAGDGALALFPAPPERGTAAAEAALRLHARFSELRKHWQPLSQPCTQVDLGVGLSGGALFWGTVGSGARLDFTAIGSTVNVAQRLAADCPQGGVYCCEAVRRQLGETMVLQSLGPLQPRGMTRALNLFQILGPA